MKKRVIPLPRPEKLRRIPPHFSWIDHRFVRDNHLQQCRTPALALYLFLVVVADKDGISYYRDSTIMAMLRWDHERLRSARNELRRNELIAYQAPFYQVLDLDPEPPLPPADVPDNPTSPPAPATQQQIDDIIENWKQKHHYSAGEQS